MHVTVIEEVPYIVDNNNVLHVVIPPIDMNESTNTQIIHQIFEVIRRIHLYFCENENNFENVDWKDYFTNLHSGLFNSYFSGFGITINLVTIDLDVRYGSITEADYYRFPTNPPGDPRLIYTYTKPDGNWPVMSVTVPETQGNTFEATIAHPDCP